VSLGNRIFLGLSAPGGSFPTVKRRRLGFMMIRNWQRVVFAL